MSTNLTIFDVVCQNFGQLDELVSVANDNQVSISDEVLEPLTIGDYEGDQKKKDAIALQNLTFNNHYES
jgi:hypothetical protein